MRIYCQNVGDVGKDRGGGSAAFDASRKPHGRSEWGKKVWGGGGTTDKTVLLLVLLFTQISLDKIFHLSLGT
jgi:hypothetical protein